MLSWVGFATMTAVFFHEPFMAKRDEIVTFCNEFLRVEQFEDGCINGMQVQGKEEVEKIILGVTVNLPLIKEAVKKKADMIIAHHGVFYGRKLFALHGHTKNRLKVILEHDLNILGYHLPLDYHEEVGNTVQVLRKLGFHTIERAGVDFYGILDEPISFDELAKRAKEEISEKLYLMPCGKKHIKTLLVVTGGGAKYVDKAMELKLDAFLTGEIEEAIVDVVQENHVNYICAGHYNTEKFGIQALGEEIAKHFDVEVEFVDIPKDV